MNYTAASAEMKAKLDAFLSKSGHSGVSREFVQYAERNNIVIVLVKTPWAPEGESLGSFRS